MPKEEGWGLSMFWNLCLEGKQRPPLFSKICFITLNLLTLRGPPSGWQCLEQALTLLGHSRAVGAMGRQCVPPCTGCAWKCSFKHKWGEEVITGRVRGLNLSKCSWPLIDFMQWYSYLQEHQVRVRYLCIYGDAGNLMSLCPAEQMSDSSFQWPYVWGVLFYPLGNRSKRSHWPHSTAPLNLFVGWFGAFFGRDSKAST